MCRKRNEKPVAPSLEKEELPVLPVTNSMMMRRSMLYWEELKPWAGMEFFVNKTVQ